jgi:radical SAM protein with 4Fe4S-binding SPASM domain
MQNDLNYNINDLSIENAREVTVKCNGKRFRIFLELVTSCYGNCSGCSLSFIDKTKISPSMDISQIQKTLNYFVNIINNKTDLRTTVINLGTGDYFMMSDDYLLSLFKSIRIFFDKLNTIRNVLTFSTSLSLPQEKIKSKLEIMTKYLHKSQFAVEAVIDPARLEKDYSRYLTNLNDITKYLPFFDVVLNISNSLKPEHGKILASFLKESNCLNFDIQYAINNTNYYRVKIEPKIFNAFIDNLYVNLGSEIKDIYELSITIPTQKEQYNIYHSLMEHAKYIVKERLAVKANGNIYPLGFAYGDIILDERFDFPSIGNINHDFDENLAVQKIFDYLNLLLNKNKKCLSCEFLSQCYGTGYSFYNKFDKTNSCENIGRIVFEKQN